MARAFTCGCERTLVCWTSARVAPWLDFTAGLDVTAEHANIFEINVSSVLGTKFADESRSR
jgi:hypothetical protein